MDNLSESLSSLLAATVAFSIGTSVVLRDPRRQQFVLFAVFCATLGLFHLGRFFYGLFGVDLFAWFAQTISLLLPWSADRVLTSFIPSSGPRRGGRLQSVLGTALVIAQFVVLFMPDLGEGTGAEVLAVIVQVYVVVGLAYATTRVWRAARAVHGTAAASRLRYLFYATLAALALGSPGIPAIGPIVTAIYLYFVAQTLMRERLLDLPEVALRMASMTVLTVVVTSLYAALLVWVPSRDGENRSLFLFNAAVASFAVLVLVEPVRSEIESRLEGWLFRDRRVLRSLLVQLRHKLMGVIDTDEMAQLVMAELEASDRVTRASLYLLDRKGTSLGLVRHIGPVPLVQLDLATRRPLLERMLKRGPLLRDMLQRERERERAGLDAQAELDEVLETFEALKTSLALPIIGGPAGGRASGGGSAQHGRREDDGGGPDLLGALFVDDERLLEPFSREEVALFEGVVAQAATTIQNSSVYEARKERERLAALGEMAAGLAHEIRNPLGAIKGAVLVMEPTFGDLAPQTREFLGVIVEEVDRLNRVVSQFLTYSRPFKGEMSLVHMPQVVQATLRLLPDAARDRIEIAPVPSALPPVRGDAEALRQVLHNLLLNGIEAIEGLEQGKVRVVLELRRRALLREDGVSVTVADNGPGLTPATLRNLFVPFHTTKSGGTGLGLPISQRIVEHHRGLIEVSAPPEGGASFTVLLPAGPASWPATEPSPSSAEDPREH